MMMTANFDAHTTAEEVLAGIDLAGKRAIVTGVSAGIGVQTALALAARGATVFGAARDLTKAKAAIAQAQGSAKLAGTINLIALDLASLTSVRACADKLAAQAPFDLVIANAGLMGPPLERTAEGFEMQFGVNHLAHFVLVNRLAPHIREGGRVVILASSAHHICDVDLEDPNFERTPYTPYRGYGQSKTANILFAVEFDRRHRDRGIRATAVHPGGVETELGRYMDPVAREAQRKALSTGGAGNANFVRKNAAQGASTSVWAGVYAPAEEVGGRYCEDCRVGEVLPAAAASPMGPGVAAYALNTDTAAKLWAKSEDLVGEKF
jgi:NAD(P)-dependent dehydrogenase (short-subunit alcohol dehydrogenase family)